MSGIEGAEREDHDECEAGVGMAEGEWLRVPVLHVHVSESAKKTSVEAPE
jgi:hypothetical protein